MKKIWCFLTNPNRPKALTILGFIMLAFAVFSVLYLISFELKPNHYVRPTTWLATVLHFALIYFLLAGKSWARWLFGFFWAFEIIGIIVAVFTGGFSIKVLLIALYVVAAFYIIMLNKNVVEYFRNNGANQSSAPT